ncbi:MAG TPA: acyltransferase [Acidobacteriaceae bacterium]|nr:acyltransferase [Acidobacteriaceae bacterium]
MQAEKNRILLNELDPVDSAILKGLAICAIALHNFLHFLSPVGQNEFAFQSDRFFILLDTVQHPSLAIQALFSFFGHRGVQIFVFLSAYGLARSHWGDQSSWARFMSLRIRKLYPSFLLVVFFWSVLACLGSGPLSFVREFGLHLLLMFMGLSTVLGFGLPPVGPWWFIPFIVQFYALWPLLRRFAVRFGPAGLLLLSLASLLTVYYFNPLLAHWSLNLLLTPLGHLPVLCLGILAARYPVRIPAAAGVICSVAVIAAGRYEWLWVWAPLAATVASLWAYVTVRSHLRNSAWLQRLGKYSLFVFLFNGIVRMLFIPFAVTPALQLVFAFASLACSIAIAAIFEELVMPRPRVRPIPHPILPEAIDGQRQLSQSSAETIAVAQ